MKQTPLKRRRKGEDAQLDRRLYTLWSLVVRARAGNQCEVCGSDYQLQAHHAFRRGGSVRWEIQSGACLCAGHHRWAHTDAWDWTDWFKQNRAEDHAYCYPLKGQSRKWTRDEKRARVSYLQTELARLSEMLEEAA